MDKVTIVVLNYNDADTTLNYIESIKEYEVLDHIVVVDNASTDNSFDRLLSLQAYDKVDVIASDKNGGYAYGNNFGIMYSKQKYGDSEYIIISNPDVEVKESAIVRCLSFLDENEKAAIVAPRMRDINGNFHPLSGWKKRTIRGDYKESNTLVLARRGYYRDEAYWPHEFDEASELRVDCVAGSFFVARNSMFEEIGYFDEGTFLYFEEDIIGSKLKEKGYKNYILTDIEFTHYESVSVNKSLKKYKKERLMMKSRFYYFKTCIPSYTLLKSIPFRIDMFFRPFYETIKLPNYVYIYSQKHEKNVLNFLLRVWKLLLIIPLYLTLPFYKLMKLFHKKERVIYFGPVSWKWIKQRPHFVALELSSQTDYDVVYKYQTFYDKHLGKDDNLVSNHTDETENFHIKPLRILPVATHFDKFRNDVKNMWRTVFMRADKIIFTHPIQLSYTYYRALRAHKVELYYEAMDNYVYWEKDYYDYIAREALLISYCKHVIVTSDSLKDKLVSDYKLDEEKVSVVRNGYDQTLFEDKELKKTKLKENNLVYIGTVDDWFDFDSICHLAKQEPELNIEIIGPTNEQIYKEFDVKEFPNIRLLGPIEHDLVPSYIQESDVLMMPFILNDIVEYVDPVKMYEYLYFKKPVVSSYWHELDQFKEFALFYKGKESFVEQVHHAKEFKVEQNSSYLELMENSTWEKRVSQIVKILRKDKGNE